MTTDVVWATCTQVPDGDGDDHLALPAMREAGLQVGFVPWDHPSAWQDPGHAAGRLTVVRSTWDYTSRREEFLAWARSVPTLLNPAEVLAWNTDKSYLDELAAAGLDVVPSRTVRPGEDPAPAVTEAFDTAETDAAHAAEGARGAAGPTVVVKPTVSAGSRDTRRHGGAAGAVQHAGTLLAAGRPVLVQPYQVGLDRDGETGVVVIDGQVSHAFRKGQILRPDDVATDGLYAAEEIGAATATAALLELADAVMTWVHRRFTALAPLLYARVDTVPGSDGRPLLLELELTEPSLWLVADPAAAARFAAAHVRRLRTLQG